MLTSAKKSNGFDICNKYLSSKNAINGNPIKEVRRTIIKTGFLNSFFIFLPYFPVFLWFYYYSIFKDIACFKLWKEAVPRIQIVILQPAKNLMFFLFKSKNQKRDPSAYSLRMTRKGKFTRILEQPQIMKEF